MPPCFEAEVLTGGGDAVATAPPESLDRCGADEHCAGFDWAVGGCGAGSQPGEKTWLGYTRTSDACHEASAPCGPAVRGAAHVVHFHSYTHEARVGASVRAIQAGSTETPGARQQLRWRERAVAIFCRITSSCCRAPLGSELSRGRYFFSDYKQRRNPQPPSPDQK